MYFSPLAMRELVGPRSAHRDGGWAPAAGPVTLVVANPDGRYPLACRRGPEPARRRLIEGRCRRDVPALPDLRQRSGERPRLVRRPPAEIVEAADLAIDGGELTGMPPPSST
jgi:hypothetical protein